MVLFFAVKKCKVCIFNFSRFVQSSYEELWLLPIITTTEEATGDNKRVPMGQRVVSILIACKNIDFLVLFYSCGIQE